MPVSSSMHSKCPNNPCVGPSCRIRRIRTNTAAPQRDTLKNGAPKPTPRWERRLAARVKDYSEIKPDPGYKYHRPGSQK